MKASFSILDHTPGVLIQSFKLPLHHNVTLDLKILLFIVLSPRENQMEHRPPRYGKL